MAIWMLTRNRPTGPRRGTAILVLGAASIGVAVAALMLHLWVVTTDAPALIVLLTRVGALIAPLAWAAFVIAGYRAERREGVRAYGSKAGLAILAVVTTGVTLAMLPGTFDALVAVL